MRMARARSKGKKQGRPAKQHEPGAFQHAWDNDAFKRGRRALYRFCMYGAIMLMTEIGFYNIVRIGRHLPIARYMFQFGWKVDVGGVDLNAMWDAPMLSLYGQASLWMFLVYGAIILFGVERAYSRLKKYPWFVRGGVYMAVILFGECVTGWMLYGLLYLFTGQGMRIWYYDDPLAILQFTSLAIAPMWFVAGLLSENFFHIIDKLTRLKKDAADRGENRAGGRLLKFV
jgi:hypothetical protein